MASSFSLSFGGAEQYSPSFLLWAFLPLPPWFSASQPPSYQNPGQITNCSPCPRLAAQSQPWKQKYWFALMWTVSCLPSLNLPSTSSILIKPKYGSHDASPFKNLQRVPSGESPHLLQGIQVRPPCNLTPQFSIPALSPAVHESPTYIGEHNPLQNYHVLSWPQAKLIPMPGFYNGAFKCQLRRHHLCFPDHPLPQRAQAHWVLKRGEHEGFQIQWISPITQLYILHKFWKYRDFPGGAVVKNPPANAGDTGLGALVWEDPTCRRAAKPVHHNYRACALQPVSHNYWACAPQLLKPTCLEPMFCNKRSHRNEKPAHCNEE